MCCGPTGFARNPTRTDRSCVRLWGRLQRMSRACSDAHSLASSSWDVVRSLSQLLFPPHQFCMRRDSDPVRHQTGSWSILAEADEFAAPEMTASVVASFVFGNIDLSVLVPGLATRQPRSTAWYSSEPTRQRHCFQVHSRHEYSMSQKATSG